MASGEVELTAASDATPRRGSMPSVGWQERMQASRQRGLVTAVLLGLLVGCGTIRTYRQFDEPLSTEQIVGVGGVVVRMNKLSDLPNAYGGRDIWGGKVDRGYSEIRLVEISGDTLVLDVVDINRQSSETTMDRYKPFATAAGVADVDVSQNVYVQTRDGESAPYRVRLDTSVQRDFVIAGIRVTFLEVQPYSVRYTIDDLQAK
jgi:hypothetical protein